MTSESTAATNVLSKTDDAHNGQFYTVFVDDVEFHFDHTPVTGLEIMEKAGILPSAGLIMILEDGTQEQVDAGEQIDLKPGRRFKKAPRFKRG